MHFSRRCNRDWKHSENPLFFQLLQLMLYSFIELFSILKDLSALIFLHFREEPEVVRCQFGRVRRWLNYVDSLSCQIVLRVASSEVQKQRDPTSRFFLPSPDNRTKFSNGRGRNPSFLVQLFLRDSWIFRHNTFNWRHVFSVSGGFWTPFAKGVL